MGLREIKEALRGYPNRGEVYLDGNPKGDTVLVLPDDREIEIDRRDTAQDIRAKIQAPTQEALLKVDIAVAALDEPVKVTILAEKPKMPSPLQGVGQKLGLLKHSAEQHASKISSRVDALSTRMDSAASKTMQGLDAQERDIADVEAFATDLENNNGGPA